MNEEEYNHRSNGSFHNYTVGSAASNGNNSIANVVRQNGHEFVPKANEDHKGVLHRPIIKRHNSREPESELTTSFDPMKDRHMWAMWRTAVNGRIRDEIHRLEKAKIELGSAIIDPETNKVAPGLYGTALIAPPLKRFIRIGEDSKEIARDLMNQGQGGLVATQFIYYGLPRVYISNTNAQQIPQKK